MKLKRGRDFFFLFLPSVLSRSASVFVGFTGLKSLLVFNGVQSVFAYAELTNSERRDLKSGKKILPSSETKTIIRERNDLFERRYVRYTRRLIKTEIRVRFRISIFRLQPILIRN